VVFSSGFAETDREGRGVEQEPIATARAARARLRESDLNPALTGPDGAVVDWLVVPQ